MYSYLAMKMVISPVACIEQFPKTLILTQKKIFRHLTWSIGYIRSFDDSSGRSSILMDCLHKKELFWCLNHHCLIVCAGVVWPGNCDGFNGSHGTIKLTWPHNCSHSQTGETLSEARMSVGSLACLRGLHKRQFAQATSQHSNGPALLSQWACLTPFTTQIWATSMCKYGGVFSVTIWRK